MPRIRFEVDELFAYTILMPVEKSSKQIASPVLFALILLGFITVVLGINIFLQNSARSRELNSYTVQINSNMDVQRRMMLTVMDKVESELLFISNLNEFQSYKEDQSEENKRLIEKELIEFMKITGNYDQIRFIDKTGTEQIRVNLNSGIPATVEENELQNKSARYYFRNTINLPEGTVYISPFDLNIEQGKIEQPLKPMLRFSTPIRKKNGETAGILIFNFLGKAVIENLEQATMNNPGTYSLLNPNGYWLYNDNPENEWGFMYSDRTEKNLLKSNPGIWTALTSVPEAQFLANGILYTSQKIERTISVPNSSDDDFYILLNTTTLTEMGINREALTENLLKKMIPAVIISIFITALLTRITVQRNAYRRALEESALYDQLTGLPNRKLLSERGEVVSMNAQRYNYPYAVMFIDLDGFKPVNDTFGHAMGDWLLKEVGIILSNSIRESDTAARFGGDEFIVLLSRVNSSEDCGLIAEKILSALSNEIRINGRSVRIGASIGISVFKPGVKSDFNSLILSADDAMYEIKKAGKNNYKIIEEDITKHHHI